MKPLKECSRDELVTCLNYAVFRIADHVQRQDARKDVENIDVYQVFTDENIKLINEMKYEDFNKWNHIEEDYIFPYSHEVLQKILLDSIDLIQPQHGHRFTIDAADKICNKNDERFKNAEFLVEYFKQDLKHVGLIWNEKPGQKGSIRFEYGNDKKKALQAQTIMLGLIMAFGAPPEPEEPKLNVNILLDTDVLFKGPFSFTSREIQDIFMYFILVNDGLMNRQKLPIKPQTFMSAEGWHKASKLRDEHPDLWTRIEPKIHHYLNQTENQTFTTTYIQHPNDLCLSRPDFLPLATYVFNQHRHLFKKTHLFDSTKAGQTVRLLTKAMNSLATDIL